MYNVLVMNTRKISIYNLLVTLPLGCCIGEKMLPRLGPPPPPGPAIHPVRPSFCRQLIYLKTWPCLYVHSSIIRMLKHTLFP